MVTLGHRRNPPPITVVECASLIPPYEVIFFLARRDESIVVRKSLIDSDLTGHLNLAGGLGYAAGRFIRHRGHGDLAQIGWEAHG